MLKRPLLMLFACLTLILGGCALSPQKLSPKPEVDTDRISLQAQGQPIRLVVVDGRTEQEIGTRGGVYGTTSYLSLPTNDILPKLKTQVDRGLRLLGLVPGEDSNAPQLTVTLTLVDYQAVRAGINAQSSVRASLSVQTENGNRRYQGIYTSTVTRSFPNSPDKRANNQLLTQVLSDALDRMFADKGMVQELLVQ